MSEVHGCGARVLEGSWILLSNFAHNYGRERATVRRYIDPGLVRGKRIGDRWFVHEDYLRRAV